METVRKETGSWNIDTTSGYLTPMSNYTMNCRCFMTFIKTRKESFNVKGPSNFLRVQQRECGRPWSSIWLIHTHCSKQGHAQGQGHGGFLYYAMQCTRYKGTGTGTRTHCFLSCLSRSLSRSRVKQCELILSSLPAKLYQSHSFILRPH